jgi:hypothetical protein
MPGSLPTLRSKVRLSAFPSAMLSGFLAFQTFAANLPVEKPAIANPATEPGNPLNLPDDYVRHLRRRDILDSYAARFHAVETNLPPAGTRPAARLRPNERYLKVAASTLPEAVREYRQSFYRPVLPIRGFRAPILSQSGDLRPATLPAHGSSAEQQRAGEWIHSSLAREGLLPATVQCLEILGASKVMADPAAATRDLQNAGLPVDWLRYFSVLPSGRAEPDEVIAFLAGSLNGGTNVAALKASVRHAPFAFVKSSAGFQVATEAGEHEVGMLRLQAGGGYQNGILRGGSVDVCEQMVSALPEASLLMSVPAEQFENIRWLALRVWPLRRANRLTLIPEDLPVAAWAQDNGKAGILTDGNPTTTRVATLAPRYASFGEGQSLFLGGESFLMDGLMAAGHPVIHSPLLFQGGNLLPLRDPVQGDRVLLVSETELFRNTALGLTRDQVLEAFRIEFGVDRCVVLPALSYHLDYDVSPRLHDGKIIAFVNDPEAAAKIITERVLALLEEKRVLTSERGRTLRDKLARGGPVSAELRPILKSFTTSNGQFSVDFVRWFAADPLDPAVGNLQSFLAALDVLEASEPGGVSGVSDPASEPYFESLREIARTAEAQRAVLRSLGWTIVSVPSMPDLYRSFNYLNGLHDPQRYLIPAIGGLFAVLDSAATRAFQAVLGEKVRIVPIISTDIQAHHGAVHCVTAAYPRLPVGPSAQP